MNSIPEKFKIDYARYRIDMAAKACSRLLAQDQASPVFKAFVNALISAGPQWAYDEILKQQEANSLYMAESGNLDAIGRIVGQPRTVYRYDESRWFFSDRPGQGGDQAFAWVINAPVGGDSIAGDAEYRRLILVRILCNFTRFASLPELAYLAEFATGETVSWQRAGPMIVDILVRTGLARWKLDYLTRCSTTAEADDVFLFPYPAILNLASVIFVPARAFFADRGDGHQPDSGYAAVGRNTSFS